MLILFSLVVRQIDVLEVDGVYYGMCLHCYFSGVMFISSQSVEVIPRASSFSFGRRRISKYTPTNFVSSKGFQAATGTKLISALVFQPYAVKFVEERRRH